MSMELSARDKKLLVYLLALAIIALAYMFGARPFLDRTDANNEKITALTTEVSQLTSIYENNEAYAQRIADGKVKIAEAMNKFPGGLSEENTLIMIQDIEDNTGAWISRVSFAEEETALDTAAQPAATDETGAETTAETTASEEVITTEEGALNPADIVPVRQNLTLEYRCNYDSFKHFIKYVKEYDSRLMITSMSCKYSPEANEVSGTVVLTQYAIYGTGKEINIPDLSGISTGTDNIFTTLGGTTGTAGTEQGLDMQTMENPDAEGMTEEGQTDENSDNGTEEAPSEENETPPQQNTGSAPGII